MCDCVASCKSVHGLVRTGEAPVVNRDAQVRKKTQKSAWGCSDDGREEESGSGRDWLEGNVVERVGHTQIRQFKVRCWDSLPPYFVDALFAPHRSIPHSLLHPPRTGVLQNYSNDDPSRYSFILGTSFSIHHFEWHRWQSFPRWQENRRGLFWRCI